MSETESGDIEGLSYQDTLSLLWKRVEAMPDADHLAHLNDSNEILLRSIYAIGDYTTDKTDVSDEFSHELTRIDLKLNLALELIGQVLYNQVDFPKTTWVRVTPELMEWKTADSSLQDDDLLFVQLYLQRGIPKPLSLYGRVLPKKPDSKAEELVSVRIVGLSTAAATWLEKFIFRQHRREIAFHRSR